MRYAGLLPKKFLDIEEAFHECDDDMDDINIKYMETREDILREFYTWDMIKYDLETYHVGGSCH